MNLIRGQHYIPTCDQNVTSSGRVEYQGTVVCDYSNYPDVDRNCTFSVKTGQDIISLETVHLILGSCEQRFAIIFGIVVTVLIMVAATTLFLVVSMKILDRTDDDPISSSGGV